MKRLLLSIAVGAMCAGAACVASAVPLPSGLSSIPLANITNDRNPDVNQLNLMVTAQGIVRGLFVMTNPDPEAHPSEAKGEVYWLKELESPDGAVLSEGQGVKAIILHGRVAAAENAGSLTIRYVKNGIFKNYEACKVNLQKLAPDRWRLVNAYDGHPVQQIVIKTWAFGISTLQNVCPAEKT